MSFGPHDIDVNIDTLNFLKSIRGDLGLTKDLDPAFLQRCARVAAAAF